MPADVVDLEPQSFIVKIWIEETAEEAGHAMWRGHITHVPSSTRRYVQDLDDIVQFLVSYLEPLGVKIERRWRPLLRLRHPKSGKGLNG